MKDRHDKSRKFSERNSCNTDFLYNTIVSLFCFLFLLIAIHSAYAVTVDRVLATVGDEIITYTEYRKFVGTMEDIKNKEAVDEKILRSLIDEKIILNEAKKTGIEAGDIETEQAIAEFKEHHKLSPEEFKGMLSAEGLKEDGFRKVMKEKIMVSKLVGMEVESKIIVTEEEKIDYYNVKRRDYLNIPEKIEVKAVFIRLKEGASITEITDLKRKTLKIVSSLRRGEDFDQIADEYSDEPLKGQGGFLGAFVRGILIPQLDHTAFSLKEGEISNPIWVNEGAYILKVIKKNNESFKTYEAVKEDITRRIFEQKREKLMNEWIKKLWEKYSVRVN
jgi:peptidyl-prolyl cis-trans isomerase SurA